MSRYHLKIAEAVSFEVPAGYRGWAYASDSASVDFSLSPLEVDGSHLLSTCHGCDLAYYILEGSGDYAVGGQRFAVNAGDTIIVPRGTEYGYAGKLKSVLLMLPGFYEGCEDRSVRHPSTVPAGVTATHYTPAEALPIQVFDSIKGHSLSGGGRFPTIEVCRLTLEGECTLCTCHTSDLFYYVIGGEAVFVVGGERMVVPHGDAVVVPRGVEFGYYGKMEYLLFMCPGYTDGCETRTLQPVPREG